MGRRRKGEPPALKLHRSSGRAYVTVWDATTQKPVHTYLGTFGTPEAAEAYARWLVLWTTQRDEIPVTSQQDKPTVSGLILDFLDWAEGYYVKEGEPTSEFACLRSALTPFNDLFGVLYLTDLRPAHLHAYQKECVDNRGWKRKTINDNTERVRRMIRWAVERELCESAVLDRLQCVRALEKGRTEAPEGEKVELIDPDHFERALTLLREPYAALCRLHYLLGCRAEEICGLKAEEVQQAGRCRIEPGSHKTMHKDQRRVIFVGTQARAILLPLVEERKRGYLFRGKGRGRHASARYRGPVTVSGYRQALKSACERAQVPVFTPLQVRHTALTLIRETYGESAAQAVGGHASVNTTQIYTSRMDNLAHKVAEEWG